MVVCLPLFIFVVFFFFLFPFFVFLSFLLVLLLCFNRQRRQINNCWKFSDSLFVVYRYSDTTENIPIDIVYLLIFVDFHQISHWHKHIHNNRECSVYDSNPSERPWMIATISQLLQLQARPSSLLKVHKTGYIFGHYTDSAEVWYTSVRIVRMSKMSSSVCFEKGKTPKLPVRAVLVIEWFLSTFINSLVRLVAFELWLLFVKVIVGKWWTKRSQKSGVYFQFWFFF